MKCAVKVNVYTHPVANSSLSYRSKDLQCVPFFAGVKAHHCKNSVVLKVHDGKLCLPLQTPKPFFWPTARLSWHLNHAQHVQ